MERLREVKMLLKRWEADFLREQRRKPSQADIEMAPEATKRLYKEYKVLKLQREESDPIQNDPEQPETPTVKQVPDSDSWGSHLNRQPKPPRPNGGDNVLLETSAQVYGMRLKSKLGAASKETPLTLRRSWIPRKSPIVPKVPANLGTGDKAPSPAPLGSEEEASGDLILPPSLSALAPIILSMGTKSPPAPPPPPADKFQQLKRTVSQRLDSLDPAWLQRCQGPPGHQETLVGDISEKGEVQETLPKQDRGASVGDSHRKRLRGDSGDKVTAPAKLRRCQGAAKGEAEAARGTKQSKEEEKKEKEQAASQKLCKKGLDPSEKILGKPEEEVENPRATHKARAPRQRGNFVLLNLRGRSCARRWGLRGTRLRKQVWKQKWQKKAENFGLLSRGSDVCYRCGQSGHWASACRGQASATRFETAPGMLPAENGHADEEEEEEPHLPTLEEVAHRTNSICPEIFENGNQEPSEKVLEVLTHMNVQRPVYEPPAPTPPVEPLYEPGTVQETPGEVVEALMTLGYSSFRPGQEVAIMRILSGLSTLVVLPTGMGKSLCYQLPAYLYHKRSKCITLVISPLVSLMDDQVSGLPPCLKAVCIHSNMTKTQRESAMEKVRQGQVQVLLLSPEALVGGSSSGSAFLPSSDNLPPVAFTCIDEAHCLSQWSHNFRPSYLRLCKVLRDRLGVRCFLGLTATATPATARDVGQHLGVPPEEGPAVLSATVPPNLRLSVSTDRDRDRALISLLQGERFSSLDSIIVYCTRREETTRLAALIRTCLQETPSWDHTRSSEKLLGADKKKTKAQKPLRRHPQDLADSYHAGLTAAERRRVQRSFMSGRLRVVVATVAFGMGLDKPDVGAVIHYNMPKNFESYVQEIGRAGRDGRPAHCHLFLDPEGGDLPELRRHIYGETVDFFALKKLVQKVFPPCKCLKLQQRYRDAVKDSKMAKEEEEEEENGSDDTVKPNQQRVCHMHDRAIAIQETVESLDVPEEGIETLLCYLELHPRRWLELLPPTYSWCRLLCYGGPRQLRAVAQSSPPIAAFLARERLAGRELSASTSCVELDVVELSDAMGWEVALVKRGLRQLQWEPHLRQGGGSVGKTGVLVEFSNLSFHFRAYGDLSSTELDSVCNFLHQRVVAREKMALRQLHTCFQAFQSVAFQSWGPHPEEEEEERSSRLKVLLRDYFEKESDGAEDEEEEEEEFGDAEEGQIRADIRQFLSIRHDEKFSGRAVARIFHGIGSPCFPAQIYGRDRRFWRRHLSFDFCRLTHLATEEILACR